MPISDKNTGWLLPLFCILIAGGQYCLLYYYYDIPNNIAVSDALISGSFLFISLWIIIRLIKLYPTRAGMLLYGLIASILLSWGMESVVGIILNLWIEDNQHQNFLETSMPVRYIVNGILLCWVATYAALSRTITVQEEKFNQQVDSTELLKEAELYKLRQQLQPHFLYNSLNSISSLTATRPAEARDMVGMLSDFLRQSLKREGRELIPLEEELDYLNKYLSIEKVRFGERLEVAIENNTQQTVLLPPFLLQPILENAIKFGLYGTEGNVSISIHIYHRNDMLTITVKNPYDKDSTGRNGTGFGIKGIRRRLYLLYARNDLLETIRGENIFTTLLKIPQGNV